MSRLTSWIQKCPPEVNKKIKKLSSTILYLVRETGPTSFIIAEDIHEDRDTQRSNSILQNESISNSIQNNNYETFNSNNIERSSFSNNSVQNSERNQSNLNQDSRQKIPKRFKVRIGSSHKCSCGETSPCIHILYVFCKIFRVPDSNPLIWQQSLIDHEINQILQGRTSMGNIQRKRTTSVKRKLEVGDVCSICQDDMINTDYLVSCKNCGQFTHIKCMKIWADYRQKCHEPVTCSLCRSEWNIAQISSLLYSNKKRYVSTVTHQGCTCDACSIVPIVGERFKCSICVNYNLCSQCFHHKPIHMQHAFDMKSNPNDSWIPAERVIQEENSQVINFNNQNSRYIGKVQRRSKPQLTITNTNKGHLNTTHQISNTQQSNGDIFFTIVNSAHQNNLSSTSNQAQEQIRNEQNHLTNNQRYRPSNRQNSYHSIQNQYHTTDGSIAGSLNVSSIRNESRSISSSSSQNIHSRAIQHHIQSQIQFESSQYSDASNLMNRDSIDPRLLELMSRDINPNDYELLLQLDSPIKRGLSDYILSLLPNIEVNEFNISDFEDESCSICLSSFNISDSICQLRCNHVYHHDCITKWLEDHNSCCVCNRAVEETDFNFSKDQESKEYIEGEEEMNGGYDSMNESRSIYSSSRDALVSTNEDTIEDNIVSLNEEIEELEEFDQSDTIVEDDISVSTHSLSSFESQRRIISLSELDNLTLSRSASNLSFENNSQNSINSNQFIRKKRIIKQKSSQSTLNEARHNTISFEVSGSSISSTTSIGILSTQQSGRTRQLADSESSKIIRSLSRNSIHHELNQFSRGNQVQQDTNISIQPSLSSNSMSDNQNLSSKKSKSNVAKVKNSSFSGKIIHGSTLSSTMKKVLNSNDSQIQQIESFQGILNTTSEKESIKTSKDTKEIKRLAKPKPKTILNPSIATDNNNTFQDQSLINLQVFSALNGQIPQLNEISDSRERKTSVPLRRLNPKLQRDKFAKLKKLSISSHSEDSNTPISPISPLSQKGSELNSTFSTLIISRTNSKNSITTPTSPSNITAQAFSNHLNSSNKQNKFGFRTQMKKLKESKQKDKPNEIMDFSLVGQSF